MSETATKDLSQVTLPRRPYKLRIVDAEKKTSKKGIPMLQAKFEIYGAEPIKTEDGPVDINGLTMTAWILLHADYINYSTGLNNLLKSMNQEPVKTVNPDDYEPTTFKGMETVAFCKTVEEPEKDKETGEVIPHPTTGNPIMRRNHQIDAFIPFK